MLQLNKKMCSYYLIIKSENAHFRDPLNELKLLQTTKVQVQEKLKHLSYLNDIYSNEGHEGIAGSKDINGNYIPT